MLDWTRPLSWKCSIFLMSSFLYYKMNRSIITDEEFDSLAKDLHKGYYQFEHQHKHYITESMLEAGTGYNIDKYPQMVVQAALLALDLFQER